MLKINEQEHCSTFFDMLTSCSLFPQITLPTRFTTRTGTLIDNFFCNLTQRNLQSTAGILIKIFSDHNNNNNNNTIYLYSARINSIALRCFT